jgi:ABC-type uncharacterized transport system substrate-binding protein
MSYASNLDEQVRHGAAYVDRILKGEKPGDLPVQETTKFDLVINHPVVELVELIDLRGAERGNTVLLPE